METNLQPAHPTTPEPARTITEELYKTFVSFCDAKPQTIKAYTIALQALFCYMRENQITRPDTDDILRFKATLEAKYKPCTTSLYMTACRLFFRWTAQRGLYPNIADHVKGAKIDRGHKRDCLTDEQIKYVLQSIDRTTATGKRDYAIIALMTTAALRDIEVSRANVEDLRPAGGKMVLYIQGKGKDEKTDCVAITAKTERAIRDYMNTKEETLLEEPDAPLFTSASNHAHGERLTTRSISRLVKSHFIKCGLKSNRLTAHSLRHTAITIVTEERHDVQESQVFARHADISTTMIYAHNIKELNVKAACADAIANKIF